MQLIIGILIGIICFMLYVKGEKKAREFKKSFNKKPERVFVTYEKLSDGRLVPYEKPKMKKGKKK